MDVLNLLDPPPIHFYQGRSAPTLCGRYPGLAGGGGALRISRAIAHVTCPDCIAARKSADQRHNRTLDHGVDRG